MIADVQLKYSEITEAAVKNHKARFPVVVNVSDAKTAKEAELHEEVVEELGLKMVAEARRKAIEKADDGDFDKVRYMIDDTVKILRELPISGSETLNAEIEELENDAKELGHREHYTSEARKRSSSSAYNLSTSQYGKQKRERRRRNNGKD